MGNALVLSASYLLGSIPCAWLVARAAGTRDLREAGSGNIGATNVLRSSGVVPGVIALLLDVSKGAAAVWLAWHTASPEVMTALAGLLAIVGHVLPVWLRFRGGKGVATAAGVFALLAPRACLAALAVFLLTVVATRYVSLGSLLASLTLIVATALGGYSRVTVFVAIGAAALILVRHADNIGRLRAGTERRIGA